MQVSEPDGGLAEVQPEDIRERVLEPAIADALTVHFIYDHPDNGEEIRRLIPREILEGRQGTYVLGYDLDREHDRNFTLSRIRAAGEA